MNPIYALFCRVFQLGFRAVLPILPYREPKIMKGVGEIPALLHEKKIGSVLLVTDPFLRSSGITKPLEDCLAAAGISCTVYDQTRANPTVHNVEQARQMYLDGNCQGLIAMGGGSSMDCAKAVGARIAYPNKTMGQMKGILRVLRRIPTLIAIPTTAGTGSETTLAAVITDTEKKHKYALEDFTLIPRYAVLDPEVTVTLPPHMTSTTGMDALTHAVEAYIGRSTTRETRRLAMEATELVFGNVEAAYKDGKNRQARANMLLAAYKAGISFSKSYVGYVHAVAHSLGGQYNIPHGLANSVLLPIVLEDYGPCVHKKLHRLAVAAHVASEEDSHEEAARKFISAIRDLNRRMGIPEKLAGICKEDIPTMARHAAKEGNPLYPVPKLMTAQELERYYELVADWRK